MRRGFSILLILLFGLGPLSATLEADDDVHLPACCRRHGAHHCAMSMEATAATVEPGAMPVVSAPLTCPYYPGSVAAIPGPVQALAAAPVHLPALLARSYCPAVVTMAALSNPSRTHAGRGPPSQS